MNKLMIAVAATIALPAAAFGQAPAPGTASPAAHTGHEAAGADCKNMHAAMAGAHSGHQMNGSSAQDDHSAMDHSKIDPSKMAASCHHADTPDAAGTQPAARTQQHQH